MHMLAGVGLGLRRDFISEFLNAEISPEFIEVAPENWMNFSRHHLKQLEKCIEKSPLICHGLSLSIGGPHPLNIDFIHQIKKFLTQYEVKIYSEHLSYTNDGGYLYDLLPIPMTEDAVHYVAHRIMQVQDILGQRLVLENVSTYLMPNAEMSESEFICEIIQQADCELLLDVNNVYVNSINHSNNAFDFIKNIPTERVRYLHIAGHDTFDESLLIDTHGQNITENVWELLNFTYQTIGVKPTLLERDFNIPAWSEIENELLKISDQQEKHLDSINLNQFFVA